MAVARILTESGGYDQAFVRRWTNAPLLVRQDNGLLLRAAELGVGPATSFVVFDEIAQQPRAYDPALAVSPRNAASLEIGRAHVLPPVTNAQLVCRLLLEQTKHNLAIY